MEHYEVSDLFGKRRKPVLTMLPEIYSVEIDKDIFSVRFNVRNAGKAVAKNMMFSANIMNVDIVMSADFQRLDDLRGGIPSIQFSSPLTIVYPIPVLVRIGEVSMKIKNKVEPVVINYNLVAEDTSYLVGEFRLDVGFLKMAEEMLKQGQKLYLPTIERRASE
jgi:hypothetical protein